MSSSQKKNGKRRVPSHLRYVCSGRWFSLKGQNTLFILVYLWSLMPIFYGVDYKISTEYYTLAPMILDDIYRALDKCQSRESFFQGCNLILQWWMMWHLIKTFNSKEPDPLRRSDELHGHDWWLYHNRCNKTGGESFWYPRLQGLREEDVQWSIDSLVVTKNMVVRTEKVPYLVFVGLRGTRPYARSSFETTRRETRVAPDCRYEEICNWPREWMSCICWSYA